MKPPIEPSLAAQLQRPEELSQWERAELGRSLRRSGWTYTEIADVIPAAKSTIAGWCRGIVLSEAQARAIRKRTGSTAGIPRNTQRRRRQQVAALEEHAKRSFQSLRTEPFWCLGIALHWGEGAKSKRELSVTNSDPAIHLLFHRWVSRYLVPEPDIVLHLHIHAGNDEATASNWWGEELGLEQPSFDKTFVKPGESGHRKNHLAHGIARSGIRKSTDAWITTMSWIDCLRLDAIGDA